MNKNEALMVRPVRRNREEVAQLVAEFEASQLSRSEFSRQRGIAVTTLDYYRLRMRQQSSEAGKRRLVEIKLSGKGKGSVGGRAGLMVVLSGGRRIEVEAGFDSTTLEQLVSVLDRR
jgi:hypothetical protein